MCILKIILRFTQFMGLMMSLVGVQFLEELVHYIVQLQAGVKTFAWGEACQHFVAFTGPFLIGLFIILGISFLISILDFLAPFEKQYPDQPWMWDPAWAAKHIKLSNRPVVIALLIATTFLFLVLIPGAIAMAAIKLKVGISIFMGIVIIIWFYFVRKAWANRRWSKSELKMAAVPGIIGGPFSGVVIIKEHFPQGTPFRINLICEETIQTTTSGKNSTSNTTTCVLWQEQLFVDRSIETGLPDAIGLPFYFAIPYDCKETGRDAVGSSPWYLKNSPKKRQIRWKIEVTPKETTDLRSATFYVPVFKTPASSPSYEAETQLLQPFLQKIDAEQVIERMPWHRELIPGGERLTVTNFKWLHLLSISLFMTAMSAGLVAALLYARPWPLTVIASLVPAVLVLLALAGLVEMLCWKSVIEMTQDRIEVSSGYTWSRRQVLLSRHEPINLQCVQEFQQQHNASWMVQLTMPEDVKLVLLKRLDGGQEALAMRDWLYEQMTGIKPSEHDDDDDVADHKEPLAENS